MSHQSTTHGFTLIELLVVVSIIAVLAAMLLPAIGMIRDAARAQNCASNQRQIALGTITYSSENEGFLPVAFPRCATSVNNMNATTLASDYPPAPYFGDQDPSCQRTALPRKRARFHPNEPL